MIGSGTNALASSIVLVCRPRPQNAPTATRREFLNALRNGLRSPEAEAQSRRAEIAARIVRYEYVILPEARRHLERKEFKAFISLLSGYSDLLSGSIKARYEYLLKKNA